MTGDAPLSPGDSDPLAQDPVLARRERVRRLVQIGMRLGYGLFAAFAVLVVIAFVTGFPAGVTTAAVVALIAGCVVLAPAMVFVYAVKAADRADRDDDWR